VTDDPERAWARHRDGCFHAFHYERSGIHPYSSLMMDTVPRAPEDMPGSELLFRTPESAIAEIREVWGDGHGPDEVHLVATKPSMSAEESLGFLRTFAEQVMPAVRDL
jgi:alkanesulfonate monooxygenase SsuD/methylene tetrahydromethanopterin reductase-like flavin-dependent oxidoreductase (luciferase family)